MLQRTSLLLIIPFVLCILGCNGKKQKNHEVVVEYKETTIEENNIVPLEDFGKNSKEGTW